MTKHNGRSREEVVEIINSVLVTHKKSMTYGMPIAQLEGEYKEQDGVRIPFRELGYPTLLEFLQSLVRSNQIVIGKRDSMTVVYPRINERIAHVSALVARQKDSTNNKRYARGGRRATISRYPRMTYLPVEPPRLDSQTLADVVKLIKKTPDGMHVDKILEYVQDRNNCNMNKEHLIRQLRELYHEINVHYDRCYPINNNENGSTPACPQKNASSTNGYAAQQTSSTGIRPAGLSDSDDDKETFDFVRNEKKDVSTERRLPPEDRKDERVACEESKDLPPPNDENANAYHDEDENRKADVDDDIGILVNSRTRFRLEKLIQQHPGGIWCADLPKLYQKEYGFPLNYEDLGFDSVSDFASHLPDIFYYVRLQDKGDFKLFDAKAPKPEARQSARPEHLSLAALHNIYQHYGEEEEAVPVLLSSSTSQRLVPEGVMTVGETVAQIYVTALFPDESGTVDVVVVDVATPTFFWIQLLKKTAKFRRFMTDLHTFYSSNASKYVIPIVLLERGLNCACIFDGKWHRGLIKAVKPDNTVTVMFYDYGTVLSYPPEDIHFLHRSFSSLPAQAIPCGLYTVRPIASDKWSYSVSQEFVEKVLDVPLVAMLGTIDEENNSMLITLTNTNGPVDIHINDWMVSSGYAVYGKMGDTVDLNETFDVSRSGTVVNGGTTSSVTENNSMYSTPLEAPPTRRGLPGQSTNLHTIPEEPIDFIDSALRNAAQTTPGILNCVIQQAKTILAMESVIKAAIAKGFKMDLSLEASTASVNSSESAIQQTLGQNTDLARLEDLFESISIGSQNQQQSTSLQPPPIPPRRAYFGDVSARNGVEYEQEMLYVNGNDYVQDNSNLGASFQKHDVNMNSAKNPFNDSTSFTLTPEFHEFPYNSPSVDGDQLCMGSATNDSVYSAVHATALQAQGGFYSESDTTSVEPQQWGFRDPVDLVKPRELFEISLEQSAKSFFERLETKSKAKTRESNPFMFDIESVKIFGNNGSPVESVESPKSSVKNPFASGGEAIQQENISQTRVVYKADPIMYDLSRKDGTQSKDGTSNSFGHSEQEALEASNPYTWTKQGCRSKENYVSKQKSIGEVYNAKPCNRSYLCDFQSRDVASSIPVNASASNVPPPIPPRPHLPSTTSQFKSEIAKAPTAAAHGNADPNMRYVASEWLQAMENVKKWDSKESTGTGERYEEDNRWNIAVGGPTVVNSERVDAGKRESPLKHDYTVSGEGAVKRKDEVPSAKSMWYFQEVSLTRQSVYLIQLDNEGWLTVEEFVAAFATIKLPEAMLRILEIQNAQIPFRFIQRSDYPSLFESLESTSLSVPRNHNNRIGDSLHLVPIRSIIKILRKLNMTNIKQIELAKEKQIFPQNSPALSDAYTIIATYAKNQQNPPL